MNDINILEFAERILKDKKQEFKDVFYQGYNESKVRLANGVFELSSTMLSVTQGFQNPEIYDRLMYEYGDKCAYLARVNTSK